MHTLQSDSYPYLSHPNKHTCLKTKEEAGILIWQDIWSVLHFSGFPVFQRYKINTGEQNKTKTLQI